MPKNDEHPSLEEMFRQAREQRPALRPYVLVCHSEEELQWADAVQSTGTRSLEGEGDRDR